MSKISDCQFYKKKSVLTIQADTTREIIFPEIVFVNVLSCVLFEKLGSGIEGAVMASTMVMTLLREYFMVSWT